MHILGFTESDDLGIIRAKGHKSDPEEFPAAAKELRESEDQANTACRDKLEQQLSGYKLGYKDGLKVGIEQGRYEMGKVLWARSFLLVFLAVCLALLVWTGLSYVDQLPVLFNGL